MADLIDLNLVSRHVRHKTIEADEIRDRLNANPRSFLDWLFSGRAVYSRREARIGDTSGAAGESLSIALTGEDVGRWYDHATGEGGGDLISLFMAFQGYGRAQFPHALREIARSFFGDPVDFEPLPFVKRAEENIAEKRKKLGTEPNRHNIQLGPPVESYPYHNRQGIIVTVVRRYEPEGQLDENGKQKKTFRASPGFPNPRPLYRLPEIVPSPHVVFVEGERKADRLVELGIMATCVMGGANTRVESVDWSGLAGKLVSIWPDRDPPGYLFAQRVAGILTGLGCRVDMVEPPDGPPDGWDVVDLINEGGDPSLLLGQARPWDGAAETPKPSLGRFELINIDKLELLEPPSWLIHGMITKGGFSVLWGPPACLKSFVGLDFGLSIAVGRPWHGVPVIPGPVVYVAAEGSHGLVKRAQLWRRKRAADVAEIPFEVLPQNVAIKEELDSLIASISTLHTPPVLIIIDTLARTFGGGDENKQNDMNAYVSAVDRLREATGAHVMIVHHSGVHADARERGSNVLRGAADTVIKVERKGPSITLVNKGPSGKQKDAAEFEDVRLYAFESTYVDSHGEEHKSLMLNLDETSDEKPEKKGDEPSDRQKEILRIMSEAGEPVGVSQLERGLGVKNQATPIKRAMATLIQMKKVEQVSKDAEPLRWGLI